MKTALQIAKEAIKAQVLEAYKNGERKAHIAKRLNVSRQWVQQVVGLSTVKALDKKEEEV